MKPLKRSFITHFEKEFYKSLNLTNLPQGDLQLNGGNCLGAIGTGGNCTGGNCLRGNCPEGDCLGGDWHGGNCPQ